MSTKRLQVLLDTQELARVRADASRHGVTVSEWVRYALQRTRRQEAETAVEDKLLAIDEALEHAHPTAGIDQMLREIDRGALER